MNVWKEAACCSRSDNSEFRRQPNLLRWERLPDGRQRMRSVPRNRSAQAGGSADTENHRPAMSLARKWALLPPIGKREALRLVLEERLTPVDAIHLMFAVLKKAEARQCGSMIL